MAIAEDIRFLREQTLGGVGEENAVRWFDGVRKGSVLLGENQLTVFNSDVNEQKPENAIGRVTLTRMGGSLFLAFAGFPDFYETRMISGIAIDVECPHWWLDVEHPELTEPAGLIAGYPVSMCYPASPPPAAIGAPPTLRYRHPA